MSEPYYQDESVTLWHGDCREFDTLDGFLGGTLVTDPPYGIDYKSNSPRTEGFARSIAGDKDTSLRDWVLEARAEAPALVFGTWRVPRPAATRQVLIWDTKGALGMGAMDLPWKPSHQEVYVIGSGFAGRRDSDVLVHAPVQAMATNGRLHPHEKPVGLMQALINKCPIGSIVDPFAGSGSTLVAAKQLGRRAVGVELEEKYCEIAARRLAQDTLFGGVA